MANHPNRGKKTYGTVFTDARDAIRDANFLAGRVGKPRAIGYLQGEGWVHYNPCDGAPEGAAPEFLCFALGRVLPLSEDGWIVLQSIVRWQAVIDQEG